MLNCGVVCNFNWFHSGICRYQNNKDVIHYSALHGMCKRRDNLTKETEKVKRNKTRGECRVSLQLKICKPRRKKKANKPHKPRQLNTPNSQFLGTPRATLCALLFNKGLKQSLPCPATPCTERIAKTGFLFWNSAAEASWGICVPQ